MSLAIDLSNQVVLVTGGTKGIGRGIVERMFAAGARVAFCSRDAAECARLAAQLNIGTGGEERCLGIAADLRDHLSLSQLIETVLSHWGRIDTLVGNAGEVGPHCQPADLPLEQFEAVLTSNVIGNFHLTRLVAPQMVERGNGCILFITSIVAQNVMPTNIPYAVAKAAVTSMARSMAAEYADKGVRVNCVAPGLIRSESSRSLWENPALIRSYIADKIPMGRIGEPEEIGAICAFLASPAASYITAVTVPVDGGRFGIGQISGAAALIEPKGKEYG